MYTAQLYITYTKRTKPKPYSLVKYYLAPLFVQSPKGTMAAISPCNTPMKQAKTKPFLMRLKPETKGLLVRAKEDQRRSISSLIDESVRVQLGYRYSGLEAIKTDEKVVEA